jgi:hypothetical protein
MELGIFTPTGNNGWRISTISPQYMSSFDLNRQAVEKGCEAATKFLRPHKDGREPKGPCYNELPVR